MADMSGGVDIKEAKKELYEIAYKKVGELASVYEAKMHGCPQATMAALMSVLDLPKDLFRAMGPFQGGFSYHTTETPCGAYSAGVAIIGYYTGRTWDDFHKSGSLEGGNDKACAITRKFTDKWHERFKNFTCGGLHVELFGRNFDNWNSEEDYAAFVELGGYIDKCNVVCATAAQIVLETLYEEGLIFN